MKVEIYVDGSNSKSDGSGDGGYGGILISKNIRKELCGHIESPCTNNTAEFSALLYTLKELNSPSIINIHSDSMLVIMYFHHEINKRWKRNNKELKIIAKQIDQLLEQHSYLMIHVKGHSGNCWNERTHELANYGRTRKVTESTYYNLK